GGFYPGRGRAVERPAGGAWGARRTVVHRADKRPGRALAENRGRATRSARVTGTFEDPRTFLSRHGLRPKDSFGQCFLVAPPVAAASVEALAPRHDETVIEIGTGCGTLARMIAPLAKRVVAIERDRDLVAALRVEPPAPNVEIVEQDAAAFDY